tara:strand:+ start:322 stop:1437 length:1116 start_codon:yes stop_codon:yes gene_type:complete
MQNHAKQKILYLESLRGVAALIVAIFHFDIGSIFNNELTKNGWLMVDFFFVLSGFVISFNYLDKIKSFSDIVQFQIKRFFRLYPLHIIMLFIFLVIECSKYLVKLKFGLSSTIPAFTYNNLNTFITNILLLHNLVDNRLTWNVQSWSISSEFFTYFLFGLIILFSARKKLIINILSIVIVLLSFYFLQNHSMEPKYGFIRCLYSFFLGVLIFNFSNSFKFKITNYLSYIFFILSILLVIIAEPEKIIGINIFLPLIFSAFILSLIMSQNKNYLIYLLERKFLIYLGTISYGIYMVHTAVWWLINRIITIIFKYQTFVSDEGATTIITNNLFISNILMIIGLFIIIILAHYSYKLVEMPINSYRKFFFKSVN